MILLQRQGVKKIINPFWRMAEAEAEVLCVANVPESTPHPIARL